MGLQTGESLRAGLADYILTKTTWCSLFARLHCIYIGLCRKYNSFSRLYRDDQMGSSTDNTTATYTTPREPRPSQTNQPAITAMAPLPGPPPLHTTHDMTTDVTDTSLPHTLMCCVQPPPTPLYTYSQTEPLQHEVPLVLAVHSDSHTPAYGATLNDSSCAYTQQYTATNSAGMCLYNYSVCVTAVIAY